MTARIDTLTAELRSDSPWVASADPRLSWTVASDEPDWIQAWAEIRRDGEAVRLEGRASVLVDWPFARLTPGEHARVDVRAAATDGRTTDWSSPLDIVSAQAHEWVGRPIAVAEPDAPARPALLRRRFTIDRPVRSARLHWSALGAAVYTVNGEPVADLVLSPGWTSYRERLVHETTDVTTSLRVGENILAARLGGAWYTESYAILGPRKRFYGDQPRLIAQLEIEFEDGSTDVIATDARWRATGDGPLRASSVYEGETWDARLEPVGWERAGFDDAAWAAAAVTADVVPVPEPRMSPPTRRIETRAPVSITRTPSGRILLDFGQNLVGRLRLRATGEAGTSITVRHAEVLTDGELERRPLRGAAATDEFILAGKGVEELEPLFTVHGFRYADIQGWPGELAVEDVEAVIIGTDFRRTGWFESSHELLNRFHENVVWSLRGNWLAVPQDCPQRDERLGWTGDTQLFAGTADFLFDTHAFLRSWLRDLAIEQRRLGGLVPLLAPDVVPDFADRGPVAAWGDAIAIIPRVLADSSGDTTLLSEFYPAMLAWIDVVLAQRDDDGLWTSGRQLADWLDPSAPPNAPARSATDTDIVATAYLVRTTRLVAEIADRLGDVTTSARLAEAAERSRGAYVRTYITSAGRIMCDTQTAYALTLAFDLVDDPELRRRLGDRLADVVRRDGYHIATGLVGTPEIAPALAAAGHAAAAERLLLQTEAPSWLYPVTVGATTVWERWDGLRPDGTLNPGSMISFNHVVFGSVAAWLHSAVAGLSAAEPGYRRIGIAPLPLERLDHARAEHLTPYGRAVSGWERADGRIRVFASVPPNTTAHVELPGGAVLDVGSGQHEWEVDDVVPPAVTPVSLDSSMAELADDSEAYRAFFAAIDSAGNPFLRVAVRGNALYTQGRRIRDALLFADPATLDAVGSALADVADSRPAGRR